VHCARCASPPAPLLHVCQFPGGNPSCARAGLELAPSLGLAADLMSFAGVLWCERLLHDLARHYLCCAIFDWLRTLKMVTVEDGPHDRTRMSSRVSFNNATWQAKFCACIGRPCQRPGTILALSLPSSHPLHCSSFNLYTLYAYTYMRIWVYICICLCFFIYMFII